MHEDRCVGLSRGWSTLRIFYRATSSTKLTSLTWEPARSSSTGIRSSNSLSCASENQLLIGTACWGWKMYDVGELSMMMVSRRSRPICDRSWGMVRFMIDILEYTSTYLHVVTLVIVTTLTEKPVMYDTVDVQLVQKRVTVLEGLADFELE